MLRIVILIVVFFLVAWFLYRKIKLILMFWGSELSDDTSLDDQSNKIKIEGDKFDENLKQKEKELEKEGKKVERLKKERTKK